MIELSFNSILESMRRSLHVASMIDSRKFHLLFRPGPNRQGGLGRPVEFPLFARQRAQSEKVGAMAMANKNKSVDASLQPVRLAQTEPLAIPSGGDQNTIAAFKAQEQALAQHKAAIKIAALHSKVDQERAQQAIALRALEAKVRATAAVRIKFEQEATAAAQQRIEAECTATEQAALREKAEVALITASETRIATERAAEGAALARQAGNSRLDKLVAARGMKEQELLAATAASKAAAQLLAHHEAAIRAAVDRTTLDRDAEQQSCALREIESKARAAVAVHLAIEQNAMAAARKRIDAEHALSMDVSTRLKMENERQAAAEARRTADLSEAGFIVQRSELEKQLLASVVIRKQAEAAALAVAMANAERAEVGARIVAERATAEKALAEAARAREQAESVAMNAAIQRVVQEKAALASESARVVSDAVANEALHERIAAEHEGSRLASGRVALLPTAELAVSEKLQPSSVPTTGPIWRVGVSAALALSVGIGIGYRTRTPAVPENTVVASMVIAEKSKNNLVSKHIPPRADGEPLLELRLDIDLKSVSRTIPATNP